ncbi:GNAT family N-acetyltransferase [Rufibacter quisquiliarum]|uniref:Diamine N-acetyltransferase n=1 Tax=Rufibacter quisquiliarum TaxID=1549639 RepID=A0A839GXD5_9BACT|nr:diamine N-acetyltransferase [Rufibacter quisquiliarum]
MLLQTHRLFLRAPEPTDLDFLYLFENDTTLWPVSLSLAPFSKEVLRQYLENASLDIYAARQLRLMVCLQQGQTVIGTVDLFDFEPLHRRAGVGIAVMQEYRGKGYAREALQLLEFYAAQVLQLHQLSCSVTANNGASLALFRQLNYTQVGVRQDWLKTPTGWQDVVEFQKILSLGGSSKDAQLTG